MADGEVEIELAGKAHTLKPTFRAFKGVNALGGTDGYIEAQRRVAAMDADAIASVIALGLGKSVADIEQDVFKTGILKLSAPVSEFLVMLANGGKPLTAKAETDGEGEQ